MASIINLEDLPELVMDKITSFLNHKELLALEQVSRKLKCAVDAHFSLTDHLIIGPLPKVNDDFEEVEEEPTAEDKKWFDSLLKVMKRCGIRLRIIQIKYEFCSDRGYGNYRMYFKYIFASREMSDNCPNVENIITSPNMYNDFVRLHQQKVLLFQNHTEIYANNIKTYTGKSCKLRSISLFYPWKFYLQHSYERILDLYPNLEKMSGYNLGEDLPKFLPQFIENGLKDLNIFGYVNLNDAKKYCNIGKNLRTLRLALTIRSDDDIAVLNKLQLPRNISLALRCDVAFAHSLSENVCNSIIECDIQGSTDYSWMTKLKNLQEFRITYLEQLKVIAEESFPELNRISGGNSLFHSECKIGYPCERGNPCDLQRYLTKLLTNKGNQLTSINITGNSISIDVVWKALKHCKAAKTVRFGYLIVSSPLPVTAEDLKTICHLPNLQHFLFSIVRRLDNDDTCCLLRELINTTVKHLDFQFRYKYEYSQTDDGEIYWAEQKYSLGRIH